MDKAGLKDSILKHLNQKVSDLQKAITETQASANAEEKSSAGDKFETARAMAQIEKDRLTQQLSLIYVEIETMNKINENNNAESIHLGSIFTAQSIQYFVSISLGKWSFKNEELMLISAASPIGKAFLGKKIGEQIHFMNKFFTIESVI